MWTAKRFLILLVSLLAALSGFAIYNLFLGLIDGVPPLPSEKLALSDKLPPELPIKGKADEKLELALGARCKELQRPLRLWLPDKQVAFAAGECIIDPGKKSDGKVRLAPFSAAFFHKSKTPGAFPEISTIRCDMAILTLDRDVTQFSELTNRKVIMVEMVGKQPNNITLTNNRGTAEKSDDIDILITNGPLIYEERHDRVSTTGVVCLTDHQPRPPTVISGRGMDLFLAKNSSPNRPRVARATQAKPATDTGGVEKILLRSDVDMKFWTDPSSGFLGAAPKPNRPGANGKVAPQEKELIHIHTGGPFHYDLTKEFAWFESLPPREGKSDKGGDPFAPDQVHVHRVQKTKGGEKFDQLTCDRLDLQFRRKLTPGGAVPPGEGGDKEIETAKATRRDVNEVTLSFDSEGMAAFGNEFFYRAADAVNGPLTILKGEPGRPLRTFKDGHAMRSQELHLFAANRFGEGQRAWAQGPGVIDMLDGNDPNKNSFPTHVKFRDTLTVVKVKEGGEVFDLMTVVGDASFIDDAQKQELHGEKISVWMRQVQQGSRKPDAVGGARQELHRVVAQERVRASSPEFIVRWTHELTMAFIPEITRNAILPEPKSVVKKDAPPTIDAKQAKKAPVEIKAPVEEKKPRPPIELEGNKITIAIFTLGGKKQLQELTALGKVHVAQAGEKKGQKALDITGKTLHVKHFELGDTMIVFGDKDKPARVEADDTIITGPRITVNQANNQAEVDGGGAMEMPSNKTIDGAQDAKKPARITVYWNKNMVFDGKNATFNGGVQVIENGTYNGAKCDMLIAILDKYVSFKDGQKEKQGDGPKEKQSAKLDRLIFDKNVSIQEYRFDEDKKPLQYNKLQGWTLHNREDGPTHVTGPGWVRMLAKGAADQALAAPPPGVAAKPAPAKEWKLTHVKFARSMDTNTKANLKKTTFYGENAGVEVFHFPTTDLDANMDADRPPENGVYLRCEILEVVGQTDGGRTTQTMIGQRNVFFRTDKYTGYADIVKYVENSDIVILEALPGNRVRLHDTSGNAAPGTLNSSKVLYNRKTGKIDTSGVDSIRIN